LEFLLIDYSLREEADVVDVVVDITGKKVDIAAGDEKPRDDFEPMITFLEGDLVVLVLVLLVLVLLVT